MWAKGTTPSSSQRSSPIGSACVKCKWTMMRRIKCHSPSYRCPTQPLGQYIISVSHLFLRVWDVRAYHHRTVKKRLVCELSLGRFVCGFNMLSCVHSAKPDVALCSLCAEPMQSVQSVRFDPSLCCRSWSLWGPSRRRAAGGGGARKGAGVLGGLGVGGCYLLGYEALRA